MESFKFSKKTIHTSHNLQDISKDLNILLNKNEEAIRGYISRYIYTSSVSTETNKQLDELFKQVRNQLI